MSQLQLTFFRDGEVEGKLFGVSGIMLEENQPLIQLWIERC